MLITSSIDDIAGVEPYVVYTLSELNAGLPLYKDPQHVPFSVTQYAPLYYLLVHQWAVITHGVTAHALTTLGRTVSGVFLFCGLGLTYWVLTYCLDVRRALAWAVVLAVIIATAPWQVCARPDAMLSFFSLVTLACVLSSVRSKTSALVWLVGATLAACASVFVKQSGIINVLCVLAAVVVNHRWRYRVVVCISAVAGLTVGLGCCFERWGFAFFSNAVTGVRNGIQLDPALLDTYTTLSGVYLPLLLGAVCLSGAVLRNKRAQTELRIVAVFVLVTLGVAGVLALKRGSAINYFNDYFVFALIMIGAATNAHANELSRSLRSVLQAGVVLWLATLFVRNLAMPVGYARAAQGREHDYSILTPLAEKLRAELRAEGGYAVTRHSGLAAALAPLVILPMPAITDQLYADGILSTEALERWLANNRVSRAIVPNVEHPKWYGPIALDYSWCIQQVSGTLQVQNVCQKPGDE